MQNFLLQNYKDKMENNNKCSHNQDKNIINHEIKKIKNKNKIYDERYKQIINEINNINQIIKYDHEKIYKNIQKINNIKIPRSNKNREIFEDYDKIIHYKINKDINTIFITIVGGGGAGGIGFINDVYYYSGGGGGAGSCLVKKPIKVKINYKLKICVGKGGTYNSNSNNTIVKVYNECDKKIETIIAEGGKNGYPTIDMINEIIHCKKKFNVNDIVKGGSGGKSMLCESLDGKNGNDGGFALPCQISSYGGTGGNCMFFKGGNGGNNMLNNGGESGDKYYINGEDGCYGSGGGGSYPRSIIDQKSKLSGNGGNGFVLIEW